jgi:hypothetical protein
VTLAGKAPHLLAAALGANLWVTMVVVPAVYMRRSTASAAVLWSLCVLGAGLLVLGILRRSRLVLLLLFPGSLAAAPALEPSLAGPSVYTAFTLLPCAAALLLHYAGAFALLTTAGAPPAPSRVRPLTPPPRSARMDRQRRIYAALAVLAGLTLVTLLGALHYRPAAALDLAAGAAETRAATTTALDLVVLGLWVGVFLVYYVGSLTVHLDDDRLTQAENIAARWRLRRRPGYDFYLALAAALGLLATFFLLRYR